MDDLGWKIFFSALPAFVVGHSLMAAHMLTRARWAKYGAHAGYVVTGACIAVGSIVLIWS